MNDELRALFPVTERAIYLNHAAVSAPPLPTINAIQSQLPKNSPTSNVQRPVDRTLDIGHWTLDFSHHLEGLSNYLCEQLQARNYRVISSRRPGEKSQIVCIQHTTGLSSMDLYAHLKKRNIITAPRGDRLRISPHFYNTRTEIEELLNALPA